MSGYLGKMASLMNRAVAGVAMRFHVARANLWRDSYNPLRGLTIARSVLLLEDCRAGRFAEPQWLFMHIEEMDAVLGALIDRRMSAIKKLDWKIRPLVDLPEDVSESAVEEQVAALKEYFDGIANVKAAIEFLCLATFRGFSHLEIVKNADGDVVELAPVEQWFWVRKGRDSDWEYNEKSLFGVDRGEAIEMERFLIREVPRPIDFVALIAFVRKNLSQKDWDAFVEMYGIPSPFINMPGMAPDGQQDEYLEMAQEAMGAGAGVLPHGATVTFPGSETRGEQPFEPHLKYQNEQIVLRGTGGKLTMLNDATGIGGSQGDVHDAAFDDLADAEAQDISELMQCRLSVPFLEERFPGQPTYAEFAIASEEETDAVEFVDGVSKLSSAGYRVREEQITEKVGYEFDEEEEERDPDEEEEEREIVDDDDDEAEEEALKNRATPEVLRGVAARAIADVVGVEASMLESGRAVFARVDELMRDGALTDAEALAQVERLALAMPEFFSGGVSREAVDALNAAMGSAVFQGAADSFSLKPKKQTI